MTYRKVTEITAEEFLATLGPAPQTQHSIFVKLGGDPHDLNYARLSYLTAALRRDGHDIQTSRSRGVWIDSPE
jgi:organic radical activating enzyme